MQEPLTGPAPDGPDELRRRGSLVLQTVPILLIPFGVSLVAVLLMRMFFVPSPGLPTSPNPTLPILVLVIFFSALILLVRLRRPTISALVLIGVWTLITVGAAVRGGVTSNLIALLIVPICVAGLLIDAVASISLAALATLLVVSLAWLELQGVTVDGPGPPLPFEVQLVGAAFFWIVLFWIIAALTSLLSRGLQQALRASRQRAAEDSALLRVGQEALANSVRHGEASAATVVLSYSERAVELRVADDGRGFPPELLVRRPAPGPWGGFGLLGMQERIGALGGQLLLSNAGGACVHVVVPRAQAELRRSAV